MKIDISIIIPAFNEQDSITILLNQIKKEQQINNFGVIEIIFIDDGSNDKTLLNASEWLSSNKIKAKLILFRVNRGKSAALNEAFFESKGDIVITMDADLQDDPSEIKNFILKLNQGYDLVSGWKINRKDPLSKTIPSKFFNFITSKTSGLKLKDFNCGFKAYKKDLVKDLKIYGELHRYIPILAHNMGYKVTQIPVKHNARRFDKSKFGIERYLRGFLDLLTVLFLNNYRYRPLHLFGSIGLAFVLLGSIIELYLVYHWFNGVGIGNRPLFLLGILLIIVGLQSFFFGLIGEMMVGNNKVKNKYQIKEFNEK